jgi:molybdate transport system ATP-binding protein
MLECSLKKKIGHFNLDVNLSANDEVTAILGASGSGKSMVLGCIAGIVNPDSGFIKLNNKVLFDSEKKINLPPQKRKTGLLFQDYALFPNMTIAENIYYGTDKKLTKTERNEKMITIAETFRINKHLEKYPNELSGGEKQRSALARIFAGNPDILMLDEPFSALDSHLRWELEDELREIFAKFLKTVLYVSHNRNEVYRLCDTVSVLSKGKSIVTKNKNELFQNPEYYQAAKLTGCKNIINVSVKNERIYVPDWDEYVNIETHEQIKSIGIRANHIHPYQSVTKEKEAICISFPFEIVSEIHDTFTDILLVRKKGTFSAPLRWEMPKKSRENLRNIPQVLAITKDSVLCLK